MYTVDDLINYSVEMNDSIRAFSSTFPYAEQAAYNSLITKTYEKRSGPNKDINVITATQIIVLLLFACGIIFALLMYCKTCSRSAQTRYMEQSRCSNGNNQTDSDSLYCCTINDSRERPPSYTESCNAPPLYGSPYNRASMLEPPPVYPDTPKLSDRGQSQGFLITYHMSKFYRNFCGALWTSRQESSVVSL
ncbi:uncharacterized protein LOC117219673 isoform X3 [Megalopta genalis]|uniref:uncharacterized protein LOC117219673 isoform X3 n=1 Tax=Megalopta genalis TaxID=115081 RepID=UPI003FD1F76A